MVVYCHSLSRAWPLNDQKTMFLLCNYYLMQLFKNLDVFVIEYLTHMPTIKAIEQCHRKAAYWKS